MDEEKLLQEEEQNKTWKEKVYSERFMRWVNVLFVFIIILRMPLLTIAGCGLWLVYLVCGFVLTKNTTLRIVFCVLAAVAMAGIVIGILGL